VVDIATEHLFMEVGLYSRMLELHYGYYEYNRSLIHIGYFPTCALDVFLHLLSTFTKGMYRVLLSLL
jgi:hypothetical protein